MNNRLFPVALFVLAGALPACSDSDRQPGATRPAAPATGQPAAPGPRATRAADSTALTRLVRNLYRAHLTQHLDSEFPVKFIPPADTIFTGIDWPAYDNNSRALAASGFFTPDFITSQRRIALTLDSSMRQAPIDWRNSKDGIPIWNTDADDWCECQDNPDDYWKTITLHNFRFNQDTATFTWTWGTTGGMEANRYLLKARKANGTWQISYMDGFKYYGSVADYHKIMHQ